MAGWYVDEGLQTLIRQWRERHPGAVVYTIGDTSHSSDPDVSQHAPDDGGTAPGDDRGEVDGADFMPGPDVSMAELVDLRDELVDSRDPRLLLLIIRQQIVSSVVRPWVVRDYGGAYHGHLHVSINDRFDRNTTPWNLGDPVRDYTYREIAGRLPELRVGDEDQPGRTQYVRRAQGALNAVWGADLDVDGVYGTATARALRQAMDGDPNRSSTDGGKLYIPEWRRLFGIWG
jgi:hypothetical protein